MHFPIKIGFALDTCAIERRKVDKKSKPTRKLKHANSILDYFEYFCMPNVIKIDRYNFELYRLKFCASF